MVQPGYAGLAALGALLVFASGSPAAGSVAHPRFSYDRSRPLDLRLGPAQSSGGIVHQRLTFDAGRGPKTGYWTHPDGRGPWPVVLFSPGSGGDAASQLPDADRLARRGLASLTVDPPRVLWSCRAAADVRTYAAYVVGRRRALDLIPHLPGADSSRAAAVGFSFGSAVTAALAGVDHRLRGAAIQSGRAHLSAPIAAACAPQLGPRKTKAYRRAYSAIDPVYYVSRAAPASLFFQNGTRDPISPRADVAAYVRAASAPKEARLYPAGHELDERARTELDNWVVQLLTR
jgi:dienelactone hydrolase